MTDSVLGDSDEPILLGVCVSAGEELHPKQLQRRPQLHKPALGICGCSAHVHVHIYIIMMYLCVSWFVLYIDGVFESPS